MPGGGGVASGLVLGSLIVTAVWICAKSKPEKVLEAEGDSVDDGMMAGLNIRAGVGSQYPNVHISGMSSLAANCGGGRAGAGPTRPSPPPHPSQARMAMDRRSFSPRQCIQCPPAQPVCPAQCVAGCDLIAQTCSQCPTMRCTAAPDSSDSGGGISKGALAGVIVGCLILFAAGVLLFIYLRRRAQAAIVTTREKALATIAGSAPNSSSAAKSGFAANTVGITNTVVPGGALPPPDLGEKNSASSPPATASSAGGGAGGGQLYTHANHDLDPETGLVTHNPFTDAATISTTDTGSNVIPIHYVPPGARSPTSPMAPSRPERSPDLNLRLAPHPNAPHDSFASSLQPPHLSSPYAESQRSGATGHSWASTLSTGSSIMYDSPTIVNATQGVVRQVVLGVGKAEVVRVPSSGKRSIPEKLGGGTNKSSSSLHVPSSSMSRANRQRSPLANSSFIPMAIPEVPLSPHPASAPASANPFSDSATVEGESSLGGGTSTLQRQESDNSLHTTSTFGTQLPARSPGETSTGSVDAEHEGESNGNSDSHGEHSARDGLSQEGRLPHRESLPDFRHPLDEYRYPPQPSSAPPAFQIQPGFHPHHAARGSLASVASSGSRADSILAGFPFVQPSPMFVAGHGNSPLSMSYRPQSIATDAGGDGEGREGDSMGGDRERDHRGFNVGHAPGRGKGSVGGRSIGGGGGSTSALRVVKGAKGPAPSLKQLQAEEERAYYKYQQQQQQQLSQQLHHNRQDSTGADSVIDPELAATLGTGIGAGTPLPPLPLPLPPVPPSRHTLGLSTMSTASSGSNSGLEAFPFTLGGSTTSLSGGASHPTSMSMSVPMSLGSERSLGSARGMRNRVSEISNFIDEYGRERERASLDTLALSRDLQAFPLEYGPRDSFDVGHGHGHGHGHGNCCSESPRSPLLSSAFDLNPIFATYAPYPFFQSPPPPSRLL
ncbi:hypothetical protein BOTBODRAFT_42971 [Botryobasidium botryosum FD-172 SS1]|uniref:Membrane anchor Opy2 N-terminal domain-containing protein n=1 Tax=Botryobasidium botryosum (strain FD-172 SS1) TaxID=930990 RepID=A0A067MZJ0_BOTB1|nr:hypothetical protein BOTBODRAFT_42971 [Botryobasidium botryosum FD-172 SS1]